MSYAHLFEAPIDDIQLADDIVVELAELNQEQRATILSWVAVQSHKAAAEARLWEVLAAALFDVSAAEFGALLHRPGTA